MVRFPKDQSAEAQNCCPQIICFSNSNFEANNIQFRNRVLELLKVNSYRLVPHFALLGAEGSKYWNPVRNAPRKWFWSDLKLQKTNGCLIVCRTNLSAPPYHMIHYARRTDRHLGASRTSCHTRRQIYFWLWVDSFSSVRKGHSVFLDSHKTYFVSCIFGIL